jgi:WD40 repeat protein
MRSLLSAFLLTILVLPAFSAEPEKKPEFEPIKVVPIDHKAPVDYLKEIDPILVKKCAFCHSGNVKEAKLDISSFELLMKGSKYGKVIVPGKAADSLLVKMAGRTVEKIMPPKTEDPLTPEELALIKLWINQGATPPAGVKERPKIIVGLPPGNVQPVRAIALSPDKSTLVAGRSNQITVYDAGTGNAVRSLLDPDLTTPDKKPVQAAHISIVESLAYSPDGKYVASGSFQEITLWDVQTGAVKTKITGLADRVVTLAFSSDGKILAAGGGAATEDGELKLYEVPAGKLIIDIKSAHSDIVYGVSFSPDDKMLATCGADKFVKVWEVPGGKLVKSFEGHTHHVLDVGWKSDGKLLASAGGDNVVKVWNFETGEQVRTIQAHGKQITRLVFVGKTPNFITSSGDQSVKMWNVDSGGNVRNFAGNTDFVCGVGVSPDGAIVVSGCEDGHVRIYNGNDAKMIKDLPPPGAEPKKDK